MANDESMRLTATAQYGIGPAMLSIDKMNRFTRLSVPLRIENIKLAMEAIKDEVANDSCAD